MYRLTGAAVILTAVLGALAVPAAGAAPLPPGCALAPTPGAGATETLMNELLACASPAGATWPEVSFVSRENRPAERPAQADGPTHPAPTPTDPAAGPPLGAAAVITPGGPTTVAVPADASSAGLSLPGPGFGSPVTTGPEATGESGAAPADDGAVPGPTSPAPWVPLDVALTAVAAAAVVNHRRAQRPEAPAAATAC